MPARGAWVRATALGLLGSAYGGSVQGAPCGASTVYSSCIDVNALWPSPGAGHFAAFGSAEATPPGRLTFGIQGQFLLRPLVLDVPAPTRSTREVRVVEYAVDETLLLEAGLGRGFSAGLVVTVALRQAGAGNEGITSQDGAPLASTAERDPRLSLSWSHPFGPHLSVEPRLELVLPAGDETAYAGGNGAALVPAIAVEARLGRLTFGADVGVRWRQSVELGTARFGSQGWVALGASLDVLERRTWFSVEAFALPSLGETASATGQALQLETRLVPAEWLLSVGARPQRNGPWTALLGAGSGIPLSLERFEGNERAFVGPTSAAFRVLFVTRYSPIE